MDTERLTQFGGRRQNQSRWSWMPSFDRAKVYPATLLGQSNLAGS